MLATLAITLILFCVATVGVLLLVGLAVRLLVGLILLPFRLLGWLLYVPLLIVKGLLGLIGGLVLVPLLLVAGALVLTVLAATVLVPLLPLAAVALLIWLLVRASRPAAV